ncbi:hypothetical protein HDK77DRAFT_487593 [Phyllosticta capitalensis]|uniref:Uncharacterized protein n=1 Tax=Phyllosticta capitalensis TaxID=121624 RepID=A0ABR1Z2X3_9PEZI
MSTSKQIPTAEAGLRKDRKYMSLNWTTPSGKAHAIHAIPKKMLIQFSPGIRHLLQKLPSQGNAAEFDYGIVALDPNAMGFVLGQMQQSWRTGAAVDFECRENNTLTRSLQTYKALQVLDIHPFHKRLRKVLINSVYRATPSVAVIREICVNHADDQGFTSSLLSNMALRMFLGSCPGDVWDNFQVFLAEDKALAQRFQEALSTVKEDRNRTRKNAPPALAPKLAPEPWKAPSQITETRETERFLKSESDLFEDDEEL